MLPLEYEYRTKTLNDSPPPSPVLDQYIHLLLDDLSSVIDCDS